MALVLKLLGSVQATYQDTPLKFATDHTRALLAYLAVEADIPHPRSSLATLLWPEESETAARHNLRQALFFLKQALSVAPDREEILRITPTTVQWQSKEVVSDLGRFQQLWQRSQAHNHAHLQQCRSCIEQFAQAMTCYQGEFLHGLLLKNSQPFEEWTLLLREQSHRQAMAMLGALTAYHLTAGVYDQAQQYATRLVTLEPWQEEGHRQLMQALAAQGQASLALRQYEICRRTLQDELGVPPAAETTKLYEQIRVGYVSPVSSNGRGESVINQAVQPTATSAVSDPPKRLHNLPANLTPLVGRTQQLEQLRTLLHSPRQRLLTIVGMGGMGKTRLALALLEQLVAEPATAFVDGGWFVPLIGVAASTANLPDDLAGAILKTLGVTTPNQANLQQALFHYLAQRRLLLVFDSFEPLLIEEQVAVVATEFVLALLQAAPGVTLVVTSRLPLQLLAESLIRLEGLPVPVESSATFSKVDEANYESVRLFAYHAQRTLPDFALNAENLPAVIELCRALSGMPLAIELAAALAPHFTPGEMATAIRQNLALLSSRRRDMDLRHRHLSAVLESSWQLLSPQEQTILAQCSIFVGRFSRAAAQAVTGATIADLTNLVDKSLLQQPGVGVYQMHSLLRQFAADQLQSSAQEAVLTVADVLRTVADRHSRFYLDFVASREKALARHAPRQAVEEIQQELDNVRHAWAWAAGHTVQPAFSADIVARLKASAYSLWQFYLIAGLYTEAIAAFHQAAAGVQAAVSIAAANENSDETTAKGTSDLTLRSWQQLLCTLWAIEAYMLCTQGQYAAAHMTAARAIALATVVGSNEGEMIGLLAHTQAHYYEGQFAEARVYAEQVLARAPQMPVGEEIGEFYYDVQIMAHLYLGAVAKNADDYLLARLHVTQALALCQPLNKVRGAMHARLNLANLARHKQNYRAARQEYEQVLQLASALGYRRGEASTRYELADVVRGLGEYSLALAQFAQALTIIHEIGEPLLETYIQSDSGRLYIYLGDYGRAHEFVQKALLRSEQSTMFDAKLDAWLVAALLHQQTGEATTALDYAIRSQQAAHTSGSRRYEGCALLTMGYALEDLDRETEAAAAYDNALQIYQDLDILPLAAEAQAGLARVALAQGEVATAQGWVEKILSILADHATVGLDEPFLIYLTCYRVLAANGDGRAESILQTGVQELQRYAAQIADDELRRSFMECVPIHQALAMLYRSVVP